MSPVAILQAIDVILGRNQVLDDINLELEAGQVLGVAGANGSGKTTLLRVLATLLMPVAGSGRVLGAALRTNATWEIRRQIGMISHIPAVIPELTLEEHLTHAVRLAGHDPARVPQALRVVGLEGSATRRAGESSFGMLRRAEVARLLITRPMLLLLDEAYSGLDEDAAALIDATIDRTLNDGGAALLVSHDRSQLSRASSVLSLSAGTLAEMN